VPLTENNPSGYFPRENFDRSRDMISFAWALSCIANNERANHKDELVLDFNDDDDYGGGGTVSIIVARDAGGERHERRQQHLSQWLLDDDPLRRELDDTLRGGGDKAKTNTATFSDVVFRLPIKGLTLQRPRRRRRRRTGIPSKDDGIKGSTMQGAIRSVQAR
jgi:hypothetical protein